MNTHLRDQLLETAVAKVTTAGDIVYATGANALARLASGSVVSGGVGNYKHVVKSADESVTSSATLQDDNHLLLAIGASESWFVEFFAMVTPGAGDIRVSVTAPASAAGSFTVVYRDVGGGLASVFTEDFGIALSAQDLGLLTTQPGHAFLMTAWVANSTNAGNITFQWAQGSSNGAATTVKAGSFMRCLRVA